MIIHHIPSLGHGKDHSQISLTNQVIHLYVYNIHSLNLGIIFLTIYDAYKNELSSKHLADQPADEEEKGPARTALTIVWYV